MYGIGSGTSNAVNDKGFFPEAMMDAGIAHLNIGMGSSTAAAFADPYKRRGRMACIQDLFFSHAIWEFATNDLGFSLAAQKANAIAGWDILSRRGMKVYCLTCCPHTSDSGGTTPAGNESKRTGWNDWVRDGAPIDATTRAAVAIGTTTNVLRAATHPGVRASAEHPLWGCPDGTKPEWDLADAMETGRNTGVWKNSYTADGVHPNSTAHIAAKAVIDTDALVV